jgi:hypothetical protein
MKAYRERNRLVGTVSGKFPSRRDADRTAAAAATLYLFPSMFQVVKPAARTAPGLILIGLLACSDSAGPFNDVKRSRV